MVRKVRKSVSIPEDDITGYSWQMFDHLASQIQNADTKASLILGVNAILIGMLAALAAERISMVSDYSHNTPALLSALLLGVALLLLGASVYFALMVTRPAMKRARDGGLFYFSTIQSLSHDEFIERFEAMSPQQVRRDLLSQVYTLAGITRRKFQRSAVSLNLLLASLYLWGLAELLTIFG
jgi:hypothetical protein